MPTMWELENKLQKQQKWAEIKVTVSLVVFLWTV